MGESSRCCSEGADEDVAGVVPRAGLVATAQTPSRIVTTAVQAVVIRQLVVADTANLVWLPRVICLEGDRDLVAKSPFRRAGGLVFGEASDSERGKPSSPNRLAKPAGVGKASRTVVRSSLFSKAPPQAPARWSRDSDRRGEGDLRWRQVGCPPSLGPGGMADGNA